MRNFIRHHPCNKCGSRDNLAEYDDHYWCFGCGNYIQKNPIARYKKEIEDDVEQTIILPRNCTPNLPRKFVDWLAKYRIAGDNALHHDFSYNPDRDSLVMPVFDTYDNLLMYQERFLGETRKYYTSGTPENVYHILGNHDSDRVILVEDLLSAIRVSKFENSMPLWGSQISLRRLRILSDRFSRLGIWLDMDKAKYSLRKRSEASMMFEEVKSIVTSSDPKEYSDEDIYGFIMKHKRSI